MRLLFTAFLLCIICFTACGKADGININAPEGGGEDIAKPEEAAGAVHREQPKEAQAAQAEEELLSKQKELYECSIEALEDMLSENRRLDEDSGWYQEEVSTIYMFSEAYDGVLQAGFDEDGMHVFELAVTNKDLGERQRYECRLLSDGSMWFTYQTESVCEKDLPDYIVNEDALRCSRVDYVYDDGGTDLEERKELRRQEAEEYLAKETGGEMQEFWCSGDLMYRIDRKEGRFVDVTADKESCIADFLRGQIRRISCQLRVSEVSLEIVEQYKPEGYSLLNTWNNIAVSDLNHDGRMDYVAVLYPDDYEEEKRYTDWSPYELSSQYYAASFWLLLSAEDGGYEQISLSYGIEYWDTALVLTEVTFVDEGVLQLEYFVGRSPFTNALLRFQYDEEDKNFYMLCSYYRDSFDDSLLTGGVENYGRISMLQYFGGSRQNYCEGNWQSADDVLMRDGTVLSSYSDSFQYACENLLEEHYINSLIWEKEYELLQVFGQHYSDGKRSVIMDADPVFYNSRLVSGQVELSYYGDHGLDQRIEMAIMVDKQSGEYATVTGFLQKEEFMQIFDEWSDDALTHGYITSEEKEQCGEAIEKGWGKADTPENCFGDEDEFLSFLIVQEGVRMGVKRQEKWQVNHYIIEKEYFWGTEVWDYFGI